MFNHDIVFHFEISILIYKESHYATKSSTVAKKRPSLSSAVDPTSVLYYDVHLGELSDQSPVNVSVPKGFAILTRRTPFERVKTPRTAYDKLLMIPF